MDYLSQFLWGSGSNRKPTEFEEGRICLKINGSNFTVPTNVHPSTRLVDFIRNHLHKKGTKFMCREAGCGACVVAVKRYNSSTQTNEFFAINSCIVPIFVCSSWNVITVEGIGNIKRLHPVQSMLAKFSGTQCGYCTPGMVMNMFSLINDEKRANLTMEEIENSFGGNICRCTGYRPILDAFKSFASDASEDLKSACVDIEDILKEMKLCPKTDTICANACENPLVDVLEACSDKSFSLTLHDEVKWIRVKTISQIHSIFQSMREDVKYMLVAGHTSDGVYRVPHDIALYIDVNGVDDLHGYKVEEHTLTVGANTPLSTFIDILKKVAVENPKEFSYLRQLATHIDLVANIPVRNIGTIAGNLSIKHTHPEFPSDIFILLEACRATLTIGDVNGMVDEYWPSSYLAVNMRKRVIVNVRFPPHDNESYVFTSYKIMQRAQNTPAYVNAAFLLEVDRKRKYQVRGRPAIVFGNMDPKFIHAENTEAYLVGKDLLNKTTIQEACKILYDELNPNSDPLLASPEYRRSLGVNLLYKCILNILSPDVNVKYRSGGSLIKRAVSSGKQDYQLNKSSWPVGEPIPKLEAYIQCTGEAEFVNDSPTLPNELHVAVVLSKTGPAKLEGIDTSAIEKETGFVSFLSARDIPGRNTFVEGYRVEEEELFVSSDIQYAGQVVGAVIATDQVTAYRLAEKVVVKVSGERKAVLDMKTVVETGDGKRILQQARKPATKKKDDIKYSVKGSFLFGGQYHYTMETQTCFCTTTDEGIDVHSATQWPTIIQQNVAVILKLPMNSVFVNVKRCGGGYGAKLGRSALAAGVCALAAHLQEKPVRMVMPLETNMRCIGKRFPMYSTYDISVNGSAEIQTMKLKTYHDAGAHINDTAAGQDFIAFGLSLYESDTWEWTSYDVYTDISPNTFCRSPGSCEAVALLEHIMEHIAHATKLDPVTVRLNNLSAKDKPIITPMLSDLKSQSGMDARLKAVKAFNAENRWRKRGMSVVFMDYPYQAVSKYHAVISIYAPDGTVVVTHGGVEIGQGLNTKVAQAVAYKLGIDLKQIKIKSTSTVTAPNDEATGGSMASDGVTAATVQCCDILLKRLESVRKKYPKAAWSELITKANEEKVDLYAESQYTPAPNKMSYNIYGLCVIEVEVDVLTGQHVILRVDLFEDVGDSMSPYVDIGQVEGAFIMGLGYWMHEKLVYDTNTGALLSDRTWTYTPPGAKDIPVDFRVYFRRNAPNANGVLRSKAIGEPPLCLSVSVAFAMRNAIAAARKDASNSDQWFDINLPYIPENALLSSLTTYQQFDV